MLQQLQTTQRHDPIIVAAAAVPRMTDELLRLAAVKRYEILDSPPEADFDRITALAADLFNAPVSVIGFVDHDRIWFKSHHGLEAAEVGRAAAGRVSVLRSIELQIANRRRRPVFDRSPACPPSMTTDCASASPSRCAPATVMTSARCA